MPKMTPGYAKNTIRRALRAVVDPEPNDREIDVLWEYFGSACAYCGQAITKSKRGGHVDHLIPTTEGGTNHISNRVLSCPPCNGDEKREQHWLTFLQKKAGKPRLLSQRRLRIEEWCQRHPAALCRVDPKFLQQEIDRALSAFDAAVQNLRQSRGRG